LSTAFASVLFELKAEIEHRSCRRHGFVILGARTSSDAEVTRTSSGDATLSHFIEETWLC